MVLIRLAAVSTLETDGARSDDTREELAMVLMTLVWGKQRGKGQVGFPLTTVGLVQKVLHTTNRKELEKRFVTMMLNFL